MAILSLFWIVSVIVVIMVVLTDLQHKAESAPVAATDLPRKCLKNCDGQANGDYPSCVSCNNYVTCSNHIFYERPCPASLEWDDNMRRCEWTSPTCAWSSLIGEIESILDNDFAEHVDQLATAVSQNETASFLEQMLSTLFDDYPACQDTFIIELRFFTAAFGLLGVGNFYDSITYTVAKFDISTPADFMQNLYHMWFSYYYPMSSLMESGGIQFNMESFDEFGGFIHASENSGLTYKEAMMEVTDVFVNWFQNVDQCPLDESAYGTIASALLEHGDFLSENYTRSHIHNSLGEDFSQMNETDVQLIMTSSAEPIRATDLIWTEFKADIFAGRGTTQVSACAHMAAILHLVDGLPKRNIKRSKIKGSILDAVFRAGTSSTKRHAKIPNLLNDIFRFV